MNSLLNHADYKFCITSPHSVEYYFSFNNNYGARVIEKGSSIGASKKKFDITLIKKKNVSLKKNDNYVISDEKTEYFALRVLSIPIGTYLQLTEEEVLENIEVFKNLEVAE